MYLICGRTEPCIRTAYQRCSPKNVSWNPSSLAGTTIVSISSGLSTVATTRSGDTGSPKTSSKNEMVNVLTFITFIPSQFEHLHAEVEFLGENGFQILWHGVYYHQRREGAFNQIFKQVVEVAELAPGGIVFARSFRIGTTLERTHKYLLDAEPLALEGQGELKN